jgi:hypothetical protein
MGLALLTIHQSWAENPSPLPELCRSALQCYSSHQHVWILLRPCSTRLCLEHRWNLIGQSERLTWKIELVVRKNWMFVSLFIIRVPSLTCSHRRRRTFDNCSFWRWVFGGPSFKILSRPRSRQAGSCCRWVALWIPKAACCSGTTSSSSSGFKGWCWGGT